MDKKGRLLFNRIGLKSSGKYKLKTIKRGSFIVDIYIVGQMLVLDESDLTNEDYFTGEYELIQDYGRCSPAGHCKGESKMSAKVKYSVVDELNPRVIRIGYPTEYVKILSPFQEDSNEFGVMTYYEVEDLRRHDFAVMISDTEIDALLSKANGGYVGKSFSIRKMRASERVLGRYKVCQIEVE